jgi:hypothetical protein
MTKKRTETMNNLNPTVKGSRHAKRPKAGRRPQADHDMERWLRSVEHSLISQRAREIFFEHGSKQGQDLDNWLKAEAEVKQTLAEAEEALKEHFVANNSELNGNN